MKPLYLVFIFLVLASVQSSIPKILRLINTIPEFSSVSFSLYQNNAPLFTFQGLWASPFHEFSFDESAPLMLISKDLSLQLQNITTFPERLSLIIFKDLTTSKPTLFIKSDDFSSIGECDQARWSIINLSQKHPSLYIYSQTSDCYRCLNLYTGKAAHLSDTTDIPAFINLTTHQFYIYINEIPSDRTYQEYFHLDIEENGIYTYVLLDSNEGGNQYQIIKITDSEPDQPWVPLIVAMFILIALCLLRLLYYYIYNRYQENKKKKLKEKAEDLEPLNAAIQPQEKQDPPKKLGSFRVESLDIFRGISLVIMIFVNYGGGNYWFFNHSTWNGLTVADLVFPWFIWIMGTSMALSFDKLQKTRPKNFSHLDFIYKIIRRSIILFYLGMFLGRGYDLGKWRIPGVLQRFGVGYLFIALIVSYVPKLDTKILKPFKDILDYSIQWILMLLILFVYIMVTYLSQVSGCPRGYTGPGGIGDYGEYPNCTGGVALYLDREIFGSYHMYHHPTCRIVYQTGEYDPEGFLGNFTSLFLTFTGYQCGRILINYKEDKEKLIRWVAWGVILCAIATGLCGASRDEGVVPINKNLWSVSFVLLLGGLAFLCIAVIYYISDMKKWWLGWPFIYVGRNSIAVYMGSELFQEYFPFGFLNNGSHTMGLLSNCIGVGAWMWIAWRMNEEGVFIKV